MQTIKRNGKTYVLVPEDAWQRLASGSFQMPSLPAPDAVGNVPAVEFARATIARGIVRDRVAAGLSQAQLARLAGIRAETLNRIEKAKVTPDVATVAKIDRALKRVSKPARESRRRAS